MKRKLLIIIIVVVILLISSPFVYFFFKNIYADWNNKKIDYSCNVDADCAVKSAGCSCCGYGYACMNKDSISGICGLAPSQMTCECLPLKPTSCECINGKCQSK
ncbi:MAG: hypothetical protein NTZ83_04710 [Candidatus Pacearchaeota archaeon]|nr:hypothetical protein [Candidatus Pacearchaeota archaeon]